MNIEQIMEEIDVLYSEQKVEEVEELLITKINELKQNKEIFPAISLMNELLGIYREKGDKPKGLACCNDVLNLFKENNLAIDENYGTTLLNIATAQRSFGNYDLAKQYYDECTQIYSNKIDKHDYRYASLYNNLSLLFCEMQDFKQAINHLEKSLEILEHHDNVEVQIATANTSLSQIYFQLDNIDLAQTHIGIALEIFSNFEDYHYSATLATAADIEYVLGNFEQSAKLYKLAMNEIEKYIGKTENYKILEENLKRAESFIKPKGMQICKEFYEEYGIPMIKKHFSEYEDKIAVGLVGQGSQCFGFDDEFSKDHDFGVDFCMWLSDDVYKEIGEKLQTEYDNLPPVYKGIKRINQSQKNRTGVFRIREFYSSLIGFEDAPVTDLDWLSLDDFQLAEATNGEIFRDDFGTFSRIRIRLLNHYPIEVLTKKIAEKTHIVSQTGQYNFERTLKRGDFVTARIILSEFIKNTMELCFLLNRTYAPFYKWTFKAFNNLPLSLNISSFFEKIETLAINDKEIIPLIEKIVSEIILELKKQGFIKHIREDNFLDAYLSEILNMDLKQGEILAEKIELVKKIVVYEWNSFDKVQGIDGRASCQNDSETFDIMRSSQFLAWTSELVRSYISDFEIALRNGRNLITEKYAYMMKSTDLENYKQIENSLPKISEEKSLLIEYIIQKQLELMFELKPKYPKLVSNGRSLTSDEDSLYNTSYETYLRGELSTYSLRTVSLYKELLDTNEANGINTAKLYMENVSRLYGYEDIETAEQNLQ